MTAFTPSKGFFQPASGSVPHTAPTVLVRKTHPVQPTVAADNTVHETYPQFIYG